MTATLSVRTVSCQVRPDALIVCHMQQQSTENVSVTPTGQAKTALDMLVPALILVMAVPDLPIKSVFSAWQTRSGMPAEFVSAVQDGIVILIVLSGLGFVTTPVKLVRVQERISVVRVLSLQ